MAENSKSEQGMVCMGSDSLPKPECDGLSIELFMFSCPGASRGRPGREEFLRAHWESDVNAHSRDLTAG